MAKQPKTVAPEISATSKRQKDYVDRLKEKGYVVLSSIYVPAAIRTECRELVKKRVAKFEKEQAKF
jgi:tRNA G26 N,N-dimethylase Trm1